MTSTARVATKLAASRARLARKRPSVGSLELLGNLTLREIRTQYKRTALGRLWSFINPLATIAIFSLVFKVIFRMQIEPGTHSGVHVYALFLAASLIPWNFISGGMLAGMNGLVGNAGLLGKVYFPRYVLIVASLLSLSSTFLTELSVVTVIMAIAGGPRVLLFIPLMLVMVVLMVIFGTGLGLMLSIAMVYFRDTQHFVNILLQLWFYLTPVIYPLAQVQKVQSDLYAKGYHIPVAEIWKFNPAYGFTEAFRNMLYDFALPSWKLWVGSTIWAFVFLGAGIWVFNKFSARVVEEL